MIQADKGSMMDWCGYLARDLNGYVDRLDAEPGDVTFVEAVAYQFAILAVRNIAKVSPDTESIDLLSFHAAQGLMRGAGEALALVQPEALFVDDKRKN